MGILKAWGTIFTVNPIYCLSHSEENLYCEFSLLRRREAGSIHIDIYNYSNELGKNKNGGGGRHPDKEYARAGSGAALCQHYSRHKLI